MKIKNDNNDVILEHFQNKAKSVVKEQQVLNEVGIVWKERFRKAGRSLKYPLSIIAGGKVGLNTAAIGVGATRQGLAGMEYSKQGQKIGAGIGGAMTGVAATVMASLATVVAFKLMQYFEKCNRQCGTGSSDEKEACRTACRIKSLKAIIAEAKMELGRCDRSKNPEKCKKTLTKFINRYEEKLSDLTVQ